MFSNIKPYFLDFAPVGVRCVSYASSIGVGELSNSLFLRYKQWLSRFDYIGLREKKGVEIVKAMSLGAEVKHVCDPTLLLSAAEWEKVAVAPLIKRTGDLPKKYLLMYDLIACSETIAVAKMIASEKGLEIVRIGDNAYGPGEFLWLFAHADYVVSNSFHGTVFSIVNHKEFVTVIPRTMSNANRIESLLESVGLSQRMRRAGRISVSSSSDLSIDWSKVDLRLNAIQEESIAFLLRSIDASPVL